MPIAGVIIVGARRLYHLSCVIVRTDHVFVTWHHGDNIPHEVGRSHSKSKVQCECEWCKVHMLRWTSRNACG